MSDVDAIIGNWYQLPDGQIFEVIALDEQEGSIEIQHFEGEVDEVERDVWYDMPLEVIEPPDDYSGIYEEMDDDQIINEAVFRSEEWVSESGHADDSEYG